MLTHHLDQALQIISTLISMTKNDIEAVKAARHDLFFASAQKKESLLVAFDHEKSAIDTHMVQLLTLHGGENIQTLLEPQQVQKIDQLKNDLLTLKELNRDLGRMVLAVGEFFNSLLTKISAATPVNYGGEHLSGQSLTMKA